LAFCLTLAKSSGPQFVLVATSDIVSELSSHSDILASSELNVLPMLLSYYYGLAKAAAA